MNRRDLVKVAGLLIALAAAIVSVGLLRARIPNDPYEAFPCLNRLRMIEGAKGQWALENQKKATDTPTWDDIRFMLRRDGAVPKCPEGGIYTIGPVGIEPTCSYHGNIR